MSWKDILKNLEMDDSVNCCEQARINIVEWFEYQIKILETAAADKDYYTDLAGNKFGKSELFDILVTASQKLSESSCEDLRVDVEEVIQKLVSKSKSVFTDIDDLVEILNDWDKCNEEPMAEKESQYDSLKVFADNQTAWMDKYIGGARQ